MRELKTSVSLPTCDHIWQDADHIATSLQVQENLANLKKKGSRRCRGRELNQVSGAICS